MKILPGHSFPYDSPPLLASPPGDGPLYLVVPRGCVDRADTGALVSFVDPWLTGETALSRFGSRVSLVFDGFNDDPRDLDQVPEVRAYVEAFELAWPHLPLFLRPEDADQALYWMLAGGGRRSPGEAGRLLFGAGATMTTRAGRFVRETESRLARLGISQIDQRYEPFNHACRWLAAFLETQHPMMGLVE